MNNFALQLLGDPPHGWRLERLKWGLSALESGNREIGGGNQLDDGIFSIGGEHVGWHGEIYTEPTKFISREFFNSMTKGKVRAHDILLVKDGATIGKVGFVRSLPFPECAVNEHVFILRPHETVDARFLFFFLQSNLGQEQIFLEMRGSAQPGLNSQFIDKVIWFIPSLPEQRAIAAYLDRKTAEIDAVIAKKERLIALLQEERQALISRAVTRGLDAGAATTGSGNSADAQGCDDVKHHSPSMVASDRQVPWLIDLPSTWQHKPLKYVCRINANSLGEDTPADRIIRYIDIGGVNSDGVIDGVAELAFSDAPSRARRVLATGDVFISTVRTYLTAIAYASASLDGHICSTGFAVLTPGEDVEPRFLYYWTRLTHFVSEIVARSTGVSYPAINATEIGQLPFPLLPLHKQRAIAAFLDRKTAEIDRLKDLNTQQIAKLREYRQALISAAVTGKIAVPQEVAT